MLLKPSPSDYSAVTQLAKLSLLYYDSSYILPPIEDITIHLGGSIRSPELMKLTYANRRHGSPS